MRSPQWAKSSTLRVATGGEARAGDCGDPCVELGNGSAHGSAAVHDWGELTRGVFVEGQDAAMEIFKEPFLNARLQAHPTPARSEDFDSIQDFVLRSVREGVSHQGHFGMADADL